MKQSHSTSSSQAKNNTICFVAGSSGGHIIPALTLAKQAKEKNKKTEILFFSTNKKLDQELTSNSNINWHISLNLKDIPYKKIHRLPIFCWNFLQSFFSAISHLKKRKPNSVMSTGGYISIPVCLAAKLLKIPVELFELNVVPGKTTKFLAPLTQTIHVCFKKTKSFFPKKICKLRKYPQRFSFSTIELRETLLEKFGFCPEKKTILILGGSQGSLFINNLVKRWIKEEKSLNNLIQIIHQTGAQDKTDWNDFYKKNKIKALISDFFKNVQELYQVADFVICRSGAGSLFETLFFKKQCITIPLETTKNNHQVHNALEMQKLHPELFTVVRQANSNLFLSTISSKLT